MVEDSIDRLDIPGKLSSQLAEYMKQQTLILEYLKKARAKIQVALSNDFLDYERENIHYYLWALSDRLEITTSMFEDLLHLTKKTVALFTENKKEIFGVAVVRFKKKSGRRVMEAYENKEGSIRTRSKRFNIGKTTFVNGLKRKRSLGILTAGTSSGRPSKFDEKGLRFLAARLEKKYGIAVSLMAVHRACKRLNINYKKNSLSCRTSHAGSSSQTRRI